MKKCIIKIMTFLLSITVSINIAKAEGLPGARSATNESGDVFLGGNYIEVGISKGGSFGTTNVAPESFKSHATSHTEYKLGLISDGDGWDIGNAPTTGDFFLPGTPEERYGISYKIGSKKYQYFVADRMTSTNSSMFTVRDESDTTNGLLKAIVSGTTPENIKIEIVYSFKTDDKYYNTEVFIKNLGTEEITDLRFLRSFDPDQDADLHGKYDTYNKVISNPISTQQGSDTNYSMVVARGSETLDGFFFVSFDNRARASRGVAFTPDDMYTEGYWIESVEGQKTFSTNEDIELTNENLNGYTKEDNAIAIMFNLGKLKTNDSTELSYYSSLDPNVIESIDTILKAVRAELKSVTDTEIIIDAQEGYEYSIDGGITWNETGIFTGLEPGKKYTVISRIKGTTETETSEYSTKNPSPETPEIKVNIVTEDNISVQSKEGYEYSIDGGNTWQNNPVFENLNPDTEYTIIARYKETNDTMYGTITEPITIKTKAKVDSELDNIPNAKVSFEVDNNAATILVSKGLLYEKIKDDEKIVEALENNDDINIKFIVKNKELTEENINTIKEKLEEKEEIAFSIDATIKLYINNTYEKDIAEPNKKITFEIEIPEEFQKSGRKFFILRKHTDSYNETKIEKLEDEDNNDKTITVSSDKFSDFTIIYTDKTINNPETGDKILKYGIVLGVCVLGIAGLTIYTKKNKRKD